MLYLASGALTALCGLVMAVSPRVELTYAIGVTTYALITGFCYSAFTATVLETIGKGGKAAATQYSLFVAAGNSAIALRRPGRHPVRRDPRRRRRDRAATPRSTSLGVVVLALVFWRLGSFGKWRHPVETAEPATDPPVTGPATPEVASLPSAIARIIDDKDAP